MPLPPNTTLSLHGYSKPGDTIQSKPKQAMIIRMSAETLDALEDFPNQPPLHFEFGDTTGIWIGDTFFPMRSEKESGSHELYLRASTAAKPTAPLKLHANIIGKFMVERELGEKAENKVRESTRAAENTRTQRQTIRLDGPPPDLTIPRKSKATTDSMFRKPVRASDHLRNNTASSSSSSASTRLPPKPAAPSPQTKPPVKEQLPARARLVHYLAIRDRTKEEILRIIGGPDCDRANRSRILDLLDELAEPTQKKDVFTLKLKSWLEVRPLEWSSLTEEERIAMCRSARKALVDMKIPRSEAAWDHIKLPVKGAPRPSLPTASASAGPSKAAVAQRAVNDEPPKRGLSSKDVKEKKAAKSKADATARGKTEIRMKDESVKASPRPTAVKRDPDAMDWTSTTTARSTSKPVATATTSATRKVPGSGFKTGISTSQDSRSEAPDRSRASPIPRNKPANGNGRAPPTAKAVAPATVTVEEKKYGLGAGANVRIKKIKTDSDGIDRERSVERSKALETSPTLKRKKPVKEEEEEDIPRANASLQKRRKTEESPRPVPVPSASTSTSAVPRAKDLSLPKKPTVPIPGRAIKKEPSPLNPPIPNKTKKTSPLQQSTVPSSSLPQHHTERRGSSKLSASSKSRRKSPIYTSSEDEDEDQDQDRDQDRDEIRRPEKQRDVLPTPSTATSNSSGSSSAGTSSHSRARPSQTPLPLPKDHAGLRSRYRTTYKDYLATFQKLVAQQDKIETLLSHGGGDSVTVTDSDGDLMDTDDLSKLSEDHKRLSEELICIRRIFGSPPSS